MLRPADTLTPREKEVMACVLEGLKSKEIAQKLGIMEQSVKNHLRTVYDKLGVHSRSELFSLRNSGGDEQDLRGTVRRLALELLEAVSKV
jgi:DNA-binding CsgD family transcriptional regulator